MARCRRVDMHDESFAASNTPLRFSLGICLCNFSHGIGPQVLPQAVGTKPPRPFSDQSFQIKSTNLCLVPPVGDQAPGRPRLRREVYFPPVPARLWMLIPQEQLWLSLHNEVGRRTHTSRPHLMATGRPQGRKRLHFCIDRLLAGCGAARAQAEGAESGRDPPGPPELCVALSGHNRRRDPPPHQPHTTS